MSWIGTVESLWRYPVKSMRGEELDEVFAGYSGIKGDRLFAFNSSASRKEFPYFTGRDQRQMLRFRPRYRRPNQDCTSANELTIDVETPAGDTVAIDDPALIDRLRLGLESKHELTLMRSDRALTDCHPVSIISLQTVRTLGEETGLTLDKRRFRANVYLDLTAADGFAEDAFVGRSIRIGPTAIVSIVKRDGRCMMITLDPDTAEKEPALLKTVAQAHEGMAGVYGTVKVEGILRRGDSVELLD
ncbi:MAG: MOSC domain-containing protein [Chthoniobacterales bacterium]|nr:MAG: MOSC domain-containing protein [Chthoniobacterales bacterium]